MDKIRPFYPNELCNQPNWVLWRKESVNGRITKIPYSAKYDGKASSTNPNTWADIHSAYDKFIKENANYDKHIGAKRYDGLGFVMNSGLVFIDIDNCICDGELSPTAQDILSIAGDTYAEVSQSGKGLHIFLKGKAPRCFKNSNVGVEMYDHKRYCAITFHALKPFEPRADQSAIDRIFDKYKTEEKAAPKRMPPVSLAHRSDADIVAKAEQSEIFCALYHRGDWKSRYSSQSEADLRLCGILAFWADRDEEVIDRIFCSSALYREKWDRPDYKQATIECACNTCEESVSEFVERRRLEEYEKYRLAFLQQ